jgi:CheY-like chemotaxis protein
MRMVLFVEDRAEMKYTTADQLSVLLSGRPEEKYAVKSCGRVDQAIEFFKANKEDIVCVITDLNMSDEWLDDEHKKKTEGGTITGWVWLQEYVFTEKPDMPTVIYSGYIPFLRKKLCDDKGRTLLRKNPNIVYVEKGGGKGGGFEGLKVALEKLKLIS